MVEMKAINAVTTSDSDLLDVRVLVTGSSGFVGRCIVRAIRKRHPTWRITGLDLIPLKDDSVGKLEKFFQVDVRQPDQVQAAFTKDYLPDLVIHTAASVPARGLRYSTDPSQWRHVKAVNYSGTVNVLEAALQAGCHRFIYTSSVTAVTDDLDHDYLYMSEDSTPTGLAKIHYGKSKAMTEQYLLSHSHLDLRVCILRPCPIIGPEDREAVSVIHDLISKGETCFIVGDGNNLSDWMYIDNAVDAHILAAENLLTTGTAAGHIISITNHEPVYFWDFLIYIWAQFGHYPPFRVFIPPSLAFVVAHLLELITWFTGRPATLSTGSIKDGMRAYYANNDKAVSILGYRPEVSLAEGIRRSCEGYKRRLEKDNMQKHR